MKKHKWCSLALVICILIPIFTSCKASTASSESKSTQEKTYQFEWIGWGGTDYVGGSLEKYCKQLNTELPDVNWTFSDAIVRGSDAMVSEAEAACRRGVNAIITLLPSAAMMDVCEKYHVYLGGADDSVDDSTLKYLEKSKYWLGVNPHGGDEQAGYDAAQQLYNEGIRGVVLISQTPGQPSPDLRFQGMKKFLADHPDMKSLGEYQGDNKPQGLSNLISLYGNKIQGALLTGASQGGLAGCINDIKTSGLDIKLGCIDMDTCSGDAFKSGVLLFDAGGNNIDVGVMTVVAYNAVTGNYNGPVYMYPKFINVTNMDQYNDFVKYINGTVPAFTGDELRKYMRKYNPEATDADYVKYIEDEFTLENVMKRHASLVK